MLGWCKLVLISMVLFSCFKVNVKLIEMVVLFFLGMFDVIIMVCCFLFKFNKDRLVCRVWIDFVNWCFLLLKKEWIGKLVFFLCGSYGIRFNICCLSLCLIFLIEWILLLRVFMVMVKKMLKFILKIKVVFINSFLLGLEGVYLGNVVLSIRVFVDLKLFSLLVFFKWVKKEL